MALARPVTEKTMNAKLSVVQVIQLTNSLHRLAPILVPPHGGVGVTVELREPDRREDPRAVSRVLSPLRSSEDRTLRLSHNTQENHHVGFLEWYNTES